MSNTFTLYAPQAEQEIQAQSGTLYSSDINKLITAVPFGEDLIDLIKAGCVIAPIGSTGPRLTWEAGRFYGINPGDTLAAVLTVASKIYAYPIFIPTAITIKTANINTTTGQTGGVAHVGIYADNGGAPGNLVFDSGEVTALTATAINAKTITPNVTLQPGWYWFASTFAASSTMPSVAGITSALASGVNALQGGDTAAHALATAASGATSGVIADFTYGALPATFPTTNYANTVNATTPAFAVGL